MQKRFLLLTAAAFCATTLVGCGLPQPLKVPGEQMVASNVSQKEIREAILKAATRRNWRIVKDASGSIVLAYPANQRSARYDATFEVIYSDKSYRIRYLSSYGLDEKLNCEGSTPCLHRNVNKWVANLNMDIQRYLSGLYL